MFHSGKPRECKEELPHPRVTTVAGRHHEYLSNLYLCDCAGVIKGGQHVLAFALVPLVPLPPLSREWALRFRVGAVQSPDQTLGIVL